MNKKLSILDSEATKRLTLDARLVAIRWDVVPWSLIFDLDSPETESRNANIRRAWVVFLDLSEFSFSCNRARLPNGCFLTSRLSQRDAPDGFKEYYVTALMPEFANDALARNPSGALSIRAKGILGVCSSIVLPPKEHGLSWRERTELAEDQMMIDALKESIS